MLHVRDGGAGGIYSRSAGGDGSAQAGGARCGGGSGAARAGGAPGDGRQLAHGARNRRAARHHQRVRRVPARRQGRQDPGACAFPPAMPDTTSHCPTLTLQLTYSSSDHKVYILGELKPLLFNFFRQQITSLGTLISPADRISTCWLPCPFLQLSAAS